MTTDVIVLNGGSSAGTSTLARALQETLPRPWLTFGIDTFIAALPPALMTSPDGLVLAPDGTVTVGPAFRALQTGWLHGIAEMARAGTGIILDEVFLDGGAGQDRWHRALDGLKVLWVGVHCDPGTATARERARGDRVVGMAAAQAALVHRGVRYDLEVDTTSVTPTACARRIAAHVAV
ncbi:chloramphenicol 3-O phosphotransferase [Streptomyces sp. 2224.1]|uniref:chloramphenicol phosphotransferase CPT n=1 Tax=unclassified Streptomyces TaxID=2593676 RepID=UPI00088C809A|nr:MULTISPECIES: chloramphenicol phosphotransferase CPT [unclassified Streptomyces]PBC82849.1 chloramphenicol 3-O phosphotransferase [Streptomyces sp. 2321.6]SDR46708.1 chloramphenicol 3-O phosphotransferase [Streptomyces sp. KS_16]SEC30599.1 chloramphenicol 3-O phosphotransferase [Streptomyces sp. 2224.1]SEC74105.1 chloramphenicol 3-O phosphotransferase [Streptomyces sp. 2133.1]SEE91168.1 chloramphenicol 3-O phosphotransferase [Streptomyces sp. 2112.3]